jgi:hypothetical protein
MQVVSSLSFSRGALYLLVLSIVSLICGIFERGGGLQGQMVVSLILWRFLHPTPQLPEQSDITLHSIPNEEDRIIQLSTVDTRTVELDELNMDIDI